GASLEEHPGLLGEGAKAADAASDDCPDAVAVAVDREPGIGHRQPRGGDPELREAVHPARGAAVHEVGGLEPPHLAGAPRHVAAGVEAGDRPGPRPAGRGVLPRLLPADADRAHEPEPGDHDAASVGARHSDSPPSMGSTTPVMNPAAGEARKVTTPATSSGVPSRPSGVSARSRSRCSSASSAVMSVLMYPGATAFTRTPRGPHSRARARTMPMRPALAAA